MALLPKALRTLAPDSLRDDVRLRAAAVGLGLIPPRTMHSPADARVLLDAARGARAVVEIGVYEGSSALALLDVLGPGAELHLIDPFGRHPDALPSGWGATEWATRRLLERRIRSLGPAAPTVVWHPALSAEVAATWTGEVDLLFIDGDHSEAGCELDWECWSSFVPVGGRVVFHDAREGRDGGRGLPGPTAVVDRRVRVEGRSEWEIDAEADRSVTARRVAAVPVEHSS
jgi:Methyltransferase domain